MKTLPVLARLAFVCTLAAVPGQLLAIEVSTKQVVIEVKYAPISQTLTKEMVEQLPISAQGRGSGFLKFAGPKTNSDIEKLIRDANPVRTINTAPGASSSITRDGLQFNFVPMIEGNGTSIRIDISPAVSNFSGTPYHDKYFVPGGSSLLIGVQPPANPARTEIFFITPSRAPSESGVTYTAPTQSTIGEFSRFEFGAAYNFMQTDGEEVKSLHGFNVTGFYNFNRWVAGAVQFGGYYGTHTVFGEDMYLDRYSLMAGPRLQCGREGPVRPYAQLLFGGVRDQIGFDTSRGYSSSSATAFGMSLGGGINFEVTPHLTLTPSVDYFPTFFGNDRQDNWRIGFGANWRF